MMPPYPVAKIAPAQSDESLPPDVASAEANAERTWLDAYLRTSTFEPYVPRGPFSFFGDLLRLSQERARQNATAGDPVMRGRDPGEPPHPQIRGDSLDAVRGRLKRFLIADKIDADREQRDLTTTAAPLRPRAPSWITEQFGQASRQTGTLLDAFDARYLEADFIDTNGSGAMILKAIPRLTGGAAVAVQASQNAAIQETDPVTEAAQESPVATIAGLCDYSRQLLDFTRPGIDAVLADDLGRAFGVKADAEIVNGTGASGRPRGLLNWTGILSVAGSVASAQAFVADVWQAFESLSGTSGVGNPSPEGYMTILHPRRWAWLSSGAGGTGIQSAPILPGRVVLSAGIPTNLGAGTNEDVALVVERSSVDLLARELSFRVDEDTGSTSLTVRTSAWGYLAVLVRNPAGIAKVTALTPPTYP